MIKCNLNDEIKASSENEDNLSGEDEGHNLAERKNKRDKMDARVSQAQKRLNEFKRSKFYDLMMQDELSETEKESGDQDRDIQDERGNGNVNSKDLIITDEIKGMNVNGNKNNTYLEANVEPDKTDITNEITYDDLKMSKKETDEIDKLTRHQCIILRKFNEDKNNMRHKKHDRNKEYLGKTKMKEY